MLEKCTNNQKLLILISQNAPTPLTPTQLANLEGRRTLLRLEERFLFRASLGRGSGKRNSQRVGCLNCCVNPMQCTVSRGKSIGIALIVLKTLETVTVYMYVR